MISATGEAKISVRKKGGNWIHRPFYEVGKILAKKQLYMVGGTQNKV